MFPIPICTLCSQDNPDCKRLEDSDRSQMLHGNELNSEQQWPKRADHNWDEGDNQGF